MSNAAKLAVQFVNLLVPGHFDEARNWISIYCTYEFQEKILKHGEIVDAFEASHKKAIEQLDTIDYLPGRVAESFEDGAIVAVADQISAGGKSHLYQDRLEIRFAMEAGHLMVNQIRHLPIQEEREKLQQFLSSIQK